MDSPLHTLRRSRAELPTPTYTPVSKHPLQKLMWRGEDSRLQMLGPHLLSESPSSPGARGQGWWAASRVVLPGFPEEATPFPAMVLRTIPWDDGVFKATLTLLREACHFPLFLPNLCPFYLSCPSLKTSKLQLFPRKPGTQLCVPFPVGEFQLSLLAPDVKEQLWGWQEAQLEAKQGLGRWRTKKGEIDK